MRHRIVMNQIALQRSHKFFGRAILESHAVVDARIVHQRVQPAQFLNGPPDDLRTGFRIGEVRNDQPGFGSVRSQFGL